MIEFYTEQDHNYYEKIVKFENLHPKELRWNKKDREMFFKHDEGRGIWMVVDNILVGEILWSSPENDKKWKGIAYIHGFAVDKKYQGKGYGTILKQVAYNIFKNLGYKYVKGHAKNGRSWNISKKMGAKLIKTESNWYKTGEKYHYYRQKL